MRNNDVEIIEEKGIDIDYQFKSSTENIITFKSTDIKIKLTQNDIYNIILALKEKKKDNIKDKDKDSVMTFTTNNSTVNNFLENNLTTDMLKQINNNYWFTFLIILKPKDSLQQYVRCDSHPLRPYRQQ